MSFFMSFLSDPHTCRLPNRCVPLCLITQRCSRDSREAVAKVHLVLPWVEAFSSGGSERAGFVCVCCRVNFSDVFLPLLKPAHVGLCGCVGCTRVAVQRTCCGTLSSSRCFLLQCLAPCRRFRGCFWHFQQGQSPSRLCSLAFNLGRLFQVKRF